MTIQANFPAIKPSLLLDFANTKQLDPRITFTRASTATVYDGKTVAKAEENLLTNSQAFENVAWNPVGLAITANTAVAPDGTTTADTLNEGTTTGVHQVQQALFPYISGASYTQSVFAKADTATVVQMLMQSTAFGLNAFANFDLANGVLGTVGSSATATITSVGNGWYRCTLTATATSTTTQSTGFILLCDNNTTAARSPSYTGTSRQLFLWGAQLEQRSSVTAYTATTTQPITNYVPVLLTAPAGVARFDHNPTTGESLGLLIEELRSNLVLRSEEFDNASWTKTRSSINANSYVSPGGALTADALIDTTDNDTHFVSQNVTTTAVAITFSVYAKAAGRNFVYLSINDSGNVARTTFYNLSTGAVGTTGTGITASIVPVGNGWYRCIATVATAYAGANPCTIGVASADNTATYAGNGFSGVAIWGAQVE